VRFRRRHPVADTNAANCDLRAVSDGLLVLLGYRKHKKGEWRMRRYDLNEVRAALAVLEAKFAGPKPLVKYDAPADDAEAVELFAKVRAGDAVARDRLSALIRDRE
jgi:hypothetical protein